MAPRRHTATMRRRLIFVREAAALKLQCAYAAHVCRLART